MKERKFKFRVPETGTFLMLMILFVAICTYFVPSGEFDRILDEATGRTIVQAGTFHLVEKSVATFAGIMSSVYRGIEGGADIIAFLFVIGGAMGIAARTGAITAGLDKLIRRFDGKENILILIMIVAFGICGTTFGMSEETLPFVAIVVAAMRKIKYGSICGIAIVVAGVYTGYTAGILNPFNTAIAQGIAELPPYSGMWLRVVTMIGSVLILAQHVISYGKKQKALVTLNDSGNDTVSSLSTDMQMEEDVELTGPRKAVLVVLVITIVILILGVMKSGWYFTEMSALFMTMGIVCGLIYFRNLNATVDNFIEGAKDMVLGVLFLGFSRAILVIMEDAAIMDTIVYALSVPLSHLHNVFAAWGIYISQGIINIFIPSSSGQAAAVMPILTPLSDLIGVSRQTCVLAYQMGDGFWNMITPTHSVTLAACGIAGVAYTDWFKFAWKLVLKWSVWAIIILTIAVFTGYGPF